LKNDGKIIKKKSSHCLLVKRAIEKYGWNKINKEILLYCQDDQLEYYEKTFIDLYDSLAPNGMNCTSGGEINKQLSKNTKTNISAGVKRFFRENENREKFKYMTLADKTKAKGCVFFNKQKNTYGAVIPMSWNNGKRKQMHFKTRELAQAAIEGLLPGQAALLPGRGSTWHTCRDGDGHGVIDKK
jgi:S-adenosylmethionine:tRNA-ribosyltransferase-isomerase (queuine synthetase)